MRLIDVCSFYLPDSKMEIYGLLLKGPAFLWRWDTVVRALKLSVKIVSDTKVS